MVTIPAFTTAGFIDFPIQNGPTINGGDFYVGYQTPNPIDGVIFSVDANGPQQQRGFLSFDNGVIYQGPLVSDTPPTPKNLLIRALVSYAQPTGIIGLDPSSLGFGNVIAGATADRTLTVRNTGAAPLAVSGITSDNRALPLPHRPPSRSCPEASRASPCASVPAPWALQMVF
jgi:hypothetical protein